MEFFNRPSYATGGVKMRTIKQMSAAARWGNPIPKTCEQAANSGRCPEEAVQPNVRQPESAISKARREALNALDTLGGLYSDAGDCREHNVMKAWRLIYNDEAGAPQRSGERALPGNAAMKCSANHRLCKLCKHGWRPDAALPHHPDAWCYMFRTGDHVDKQGYCGQFRLLPDSPNVRVNDGENPNQTTRP